MSAIAVIQARYSSQRFPGKVLADLDGRPMLAHVIERANQIPGIDRVILALANNSVEGPLIDWAEQHADCEIFLSAAHVDDVLGRFCRLVEGIPDGDPIMRLTGDCPRLEPDVCGTVLAMYRASLFDYAWLNTPDGIWPDGLDCEVFSRYVLLRAGENATMPADREHVTRWIRRHYTAGELMADARYCGRPKCSVDTPEDLRRLATA